VIYFVERGDAYVASAGVAICCVTALVWLAPEESLTCCLNHPWCSESTNWSAAFIFSFCTGCDDIMRYCGLYGFTTRGTSVHVAYQTSEILLQIQRICNTIFAGWFREDMIGADNQNQCIRNFVWSKKALLQKKTNQRDTQNPGIKGLIWRCEYNTCRYVGLPDGRVHFLDLPLRNRHHRKKKPDGRRWSVLTMEICGK